jgi:hypothetical protein
VKGTSPERGALTSVIAWAYGTLFHWFPALRIKKFLSDQDRSQLDGFAIAQTKRIVDLLKDKFDSLPNVDGDLESLKRDMCRLRNRLLFILKDGMYWLDVKTALRTFEEKHGSCWYIAHFCEQHFHTDIQLCLWHLTDAWRKKIKSPFEASVRERQPRDEYTLNDYKELKGRLYELFSVDNIQEFSVKKDLLLQELIDNQISEQVASYLETHYFTEDQIGKQLSLPSVQIGRFREVA